jgi:hypothetical protein
MDLQEVHQRQGGPRKRYSNERLFRAQFDFLRRQFLQDGELPLADVLSREIVTRALDTIEDAWNDSIYTPLVTLWVFLEQVLSADHCCRHAVARLIVRRVSQGLSPCSSITGGLGKRMVFAVGSQAGPVNTCSFGGSGGERSVA